MAGIRKPRRELERITSGSERLDQILHGGIPRYSVVFIAGLPGTGKTILSQQALFANAAKGRTSIYLSTISEPQIKVLRFLQEFTFFDPALFGTKVIYGDLGGPLRKDGPAGLLARLDEMVRDCRPELVVIDSISAFEAAVPNLAKYQSYMWAITDFFKRHGTSIILTAESRGPFESLEISTRNISFVTDNIIFLRYVELEAEIKRVIGVLKTRGSGHDRFLRELIINPPRISIGSILQQAGMLGTTVRERTNAGPGGT